MVALQIKFRIDYMSSKATVKRSDIVRHFVTHSGLTYVKSEQVYEALMRLLEDSIATKSQINLGHIGSLTPIELKPRRVTMGFKRSGGHNGGRITKCRREFFLGARTRFIFKMHRSFGRNHGLVP